jgi:Ca2+-binding EF-hand superfamily protein
MEANLLKEGKISQEELQEIRKVFNILDEDKSGDIGIDEIEKQMKKITTIPLTKEDIEKVAKLFERDNALKIKWEEFLFSITLNSYLQVALRN